MPEAPPLDLAVALERFEDDREFLKEMIQEFLDYIPAHLDAVRKAIADQAFDVFQTEVHSIKGAAANIGAESMRRLADRLEMMGRQARLGGAENALEELTDELDRLRRFADTI